MTQAKATDAASTNPDLKVLIELSENVAAMVTAILRQQPDIAVKKSLQEPTGDRVARLRGVTLLSAFAALADYAEKSTLGRGFMEAGCIGIQLTQDADGKGPRH